jgi:hypothetical protein
VNLAAQLRPSEGVEMNTSHLRPYHKGPQVMWFSSTSHYADVSRTLNTEGIGEWRGMCQQ